MNPCARRIFHRLFFAVAGLATLIVLLYVEENWRGARNWAATKHELQARGETLDFKDFVPPPVPDEQNLAMAPLFTRTFQYAVDPATHTLTFNRDKNWSKNDTYEQLTDMPWGKEQGGVHIPAFPNCSTGHATDLAATQHYFQQRLDFPHSAQPQTTAEDVLLALSRWKPVLDELAQAAAERPQTRFPINYAQRPSWGIRMPHYNLVQHLETTLRMRAVAELTDHQTAAARRDLALMFRLRQATAHEPTLIAGLVDISALGSAVQVVWEGLASRQWTADELHALGDELRAINLLEEFQHELRGERAFFVVRWPDDLQDPILGKAFANMVGGNDPRTSNLLLGWPRGWYEQNAVFASRYLQECGVDLVDPAAHRVICAAAKRSGQAVENRPLWPTTLLSRLAMPVYGGIMERFAQTQTMTDQALIACALERYYLDHHAYPTALTSLVPAYLDRVPNDVIDGAPTRYRLTVDGRYQLYSIGWDERDDGGTVEWPPERTWRRKNGGSTQRLPTPVRDSGDWVWQYAPAEPPDPPANRSRLESLPPP